MDLIDSHTHLYLDQFDSDRKEVIERAMEAGVSKLFLPNIDSSTVKAMLNMQDSFPGTCYAMMGLHPTSVKEDYTKELELVREWFEKERFIAVGEIGIDLYWDKTFQKEQEAAFEQQLKLALQYDLPAVIHARDSFNEIFNVLDKVWEKGMKGVFHSFTGGAEEVRKIAEYDFYFGINGIVTFKNSGLGDVVRDIPVNRIILETDSPYLAPVPKRGKRNESGYITYIAGKLSDLLEISLEDTARLTSENARLLFNIND